MVKFLRRPPPGGIGASTALPGPGAPAEAPGAADPAVIARAFLRKLEILRDKPRKLRVFKAIVAAKGPWAPRVLLELLADPSEDIREGAVRALAGREDWETSALYPLVRQPPWFVKCAALRLIGLRKDAAATSRLRPALDDANVEVRRTAAWVLGEIGGAEARTLLVRLSRDANPYVRAAAKESIDRICEFKFI